MNASAWTLYAICSRKAGSKAVADTRTHGSSVLRFGQQLRASMECCARRASRVQQLYAPPSLRAAGLDLGACLQGQWTGI